MKKRIKVVSNLNELGYSENVPAIVSFVKNFWNIKVFPKGYNKLRKNYQDFDGMKDYNYEKLNKAFKGLDNSTAGSFALPTQLSVPHVVYDECCQGRDKIESLLGSVFSYAFLCGAKYQELTIKKAFKNQIELARKLETGVSPKDIEFILEFNNVV
jgi:hypothetical protein